MYKVSLRDMAHEDFDDLDGGTQKQANKQFEKLKRNPELGDELGHKMGVNLTGYRSLHFYKNQYRIVYRILEEQKKVVVWGIGVREAGKVYQMVSERIEEEEI
ncbi:MAG: type II toxin-antitoxin system RelE/ParE family toxin [Candidatus Bipolaricaulia bacterium]